MRVLLRNDVEKVCTFVARKVESARRYFLTPEHSGRGLRPQALYRGYLYIAPEGYSWAVRVRYSQEPPALRPKQSEITSSLAASDDCLTMSRLIVRRRKRL